MFNVIESAYKGDFVQVLPDTYEIGFGDGILGTSGLETGAGISLYYPDVQIGILTNINVNENYSPQKVVDEMVRNLSQYTGVNNGDLEASICCERTFEESEHEKFQEIENRLKELDIKIIGKEISDRFSNKSMFLDCSNGNVEIYGPKTL